MKKVITYGTFDLFHEGHYRLLQRAKALGDYLIVGVTTESFDATRGKLNVFDSLLTRIENVKKTGFADEIIIEETQGQKVQDIRKYHVDIFTVGSDWTGKFDYLKAYCDVVYLERTKNISSTILREKNRPILRMGIIGTGRIAGRFIQEAACVSGVNVQSVYNPHVSSALRFAKEWDLTACESPDDFFDSVDTVYIASPHETHYEYAKAALSRGKHVLCEKPMTLDGGQARELFSLAEEKGLVLFEGIKTAYCPCFSKLLGIAGSGMIGAIRSVDACFTKLENPAHRELTDLEYGGSFTELGSYVLLPIVKLLGRNPSHVRFQSIAGDNGLDLYTKAFLEFPDGMASATCGLGVKSPGELVISGTQGYIQVEAPWWKTTYFEVHYEDPDKVDKYSDLFLGFGMRYELAEFVTAVNGMGHKDYRLTRGESIAIADIMEQFMRERSAR